jgi:hypothetical protein
MATADREPRRSTHAHMAWNVPPIAAGAGCAAGLSARGRDSVAR